MGGYLTSKMGDKLVSALNDAILAGTGSGQPDGVIGHGSVVTVAKEAAQAADTIVYENIIKMWSRMYAPCRKNAVWLINQDIEPQLMTMSFEGTSSSVPAYMPANGLSASPFATLMGRPVIPQQSCPTLGDKGDIILADMTRYLAVTKSSGIRTDMSIHLFFDAAVTAFRMIFRMGGEPWWSAPIDPRNGTATLSCFVDLADRA
jgi:HK97 family phage major capsid protein